MEKFRLRVCEQDNKKFAQLISEDFRVSNIRDALDLMATAHYEGVDHLIAYEKNFCPEFFDLKTRIAGEILQKYSNYRLKLAIIGSFEKFTSNSLRDFIRECNRGRQIFFISYFESAVEKISRESL